MKENVKLRDGSADHFAKIVVGMFLAYASPLACKNAGGMAGRLMQIEEGNI